MKYEPVGISLIRIDLLPVLPLQVIVVGAFFIDDASPVSGVHLVVLSVPSDGVATNKIRWHSN